MIGIDICATCLLFAKEIKEVGIILLSKKAPNWGFKGFVSVLNPLCLLMLLGDSIALGHTKLGKSIQY